MDQVRAAVVGVSLGPQPSLTPHFFLLLCCFETWQGHQLRGEVSSVPWFEADSLSVPQCSVTSERSQVKAGASPDLLLKRILSLLDVRPSQPSCSRSHHGANDIMYKNQDL